MGKVKPHSKVSDAVNSIKRNYEFGRKIWKTRDSRHPLDKASLMAEFGVNLNTYYKSMDFAKKYSPAEVEELCGLCQGDDDQPRLTWVHVIHLLSVPLDKKTLRNKLQWRAAAEKWSVRTLAANVKSALGTSGKRTGRRSRPRSKDPTVELQLFFRHCDTWLKYFQNVCADQKPNGTIKGLLRELQDITHPNNATSERVRCQIKDTVNHLAQMQSAVAQAQERLMVMLD